MSKTSFNAKIYGHIVEQCTDNAMDYSWLCNQLGKLYKEIDDGCVDNCRADVATDNDGKTDNYTRAMNGGCCGSVDRLVTNTQTGSKFWIGFNYGH